MGSLLYWLRYLLVELPLRPFDLLPPWLGLILISILSGVGMLWVFGKTTPQRHLAHARDQVLSCVYEMRIYFDSPRRVLAAQGRMLVQSLIYTACMLPAFVVLTIPMIWMYAHLEIRYAYDPLPLNTPILIRVALDDEVDGRTVKIDGDVPEGVRVTAPLLYIEDENRVYLRVEMIKKISAELSLRVGDEVVTKRLDADPDATRISFDRAGGFSQLWAITDEAVISSAAGVRWIDVQQPLKNQRWFGFEIPWWIAWLVLSTIAALAFRKRLDVEL